MPKVRKDSAVKRGRLPPQVEAAMRQYLDRWAELYLDAVVAAGRRLLRSNLNGRKIRHHSGRPIGSSSRLSRGGPRRSRRSTSRPR